MTETSSRKQVYIVGPSHLHPNHADISILNKHAAVAHIEGHCGMCNFSRHCKSVLENVLTLADGAPVVWMVIDWRVGNYDYEILAREGITDSPSKPNNISAAHIKQEIDDFLITKQRELLHEWLHKYPNLQLVFWCCYVRTQLGVSWRPDGKYPEVMAEFGDRALDVSQVIAPGHVRSAIADHGGHMKSETLDKVLQFIIDQVCEAKEIKHKA